MRRKDGRNIFRLSLTLKKALRGDPVKESQQAYYEVRASDPKRILVKKGDEFLICFQHCGTGEKRPVQTINLDHPQTGGASMIAASCDLNLLKTKKDILRVFEDRLRCQPKGDPVRRDDDSRDNRFLLVWSAELWAAIYGGSGCYIKVPTNLVQQVLMESKRREREALERSRKDHRE